MPALRGLDGDVAGVFTVDELRDLESAALSALRAASMGPRHGRYADNWFVRHGLGSVGKDGRFRSWRRAARWLLAVVANIEEDRVRGT